MLFAQVLEQPNAAAKQYRDEVNRNLIHETKVEELCRNVPAAHDRDVFIACRFPRFFERSFNAIRETVHTSIRYIVRHTVRNNDRWYASRSGWPVRFPIRYCKIIVMPARDDRA